MAGGTAGTTPGQPPSPSASQPGWIRIAVVVALVVALVVVIARYVKKDVVTHWKVLASCATAADVGANRVSTTLDTSACSRQTVEPAAARGWPIVTFVLPAQAGIDPTITGVRSDDKTRAVTILYNGSSESADTGAAGQVLVFVEVPPDSLPRIPFVIIDGAGTTTVTQLPPL